jgi:predicted ATPase
MLSNINIKGFKSIENESLDLKPLTIITGLNSTGKSSVIQSILLAAHRFNQHNHWSMKALMAHVSNFTEIKNRYVNAKVVELTVQLAGNDKPIVASIDIDNR